MLGALIILPLAFIALLMFLVIRSTSLSQKVRDLDLRLDALERSLRSLTEKEVPTPKPVAQPKARAKAKQAATTEPTLIESGPAPISPLTLVHESKPSRTRAEWEAFIGGRLLNRIGALALIIGVGFFLSYAFDHNWISEPVRVLLGALAGFVCLAGAYRTHQRGFAIFAQGLVGAGTAILYLSVYASFNYYALIPQWSAFLLMSGVTALAIGQGVFYNAFAIGALGWAGGFLTPWMLSTGTVNEVGLFTYVALLTAGLLGLTVRKPAWGMLQLLTFAGTWVYYFSWHAQEFDHSVFGVTLFFVLVFWGLFAAADAAAIRMGAAYDVARRVLTPFNAAAGALAVWLVVSPESETTAGLITLTMAAVTGAMIAIARSDASTVQTAVLSSTAAALTALAFSFLFDEYRLVVSWSLLFAGLVWMGARRQWPQFIVGAVGLFVLGAWVQVASTDGLLTEWPQGFTLLLSERSLGYLALIGGAVGAWRFVPDEDRFRSARTMFLSGASIAVLVFATVEMNDLLRLWRSESVGELLAFRRNISLYLIDATWVTFGAALLTTGIRSRLTPVWTTGLVGFGLGATLLILSGFVVWPVQFHQPVWNTRAAALFITILLSAGVGRMFEHSDGLRANVKSISLTLYTGSAIALFTLLTGEVSDLFRLRLFALGDDAHEHAVVENLRQISISGSWLVYSASLMAIGFWRSSRGFRILAIGVFGLSILKIFLYDLSFLETLYRIFSFIGLGVILLAASYVYQRYKDVLLAQRPEGG